MGLIDRVRRVVSRVRDRGSDRRDAGTSGVGGGSQAYRENRDAILAGEVPEKYTRIRRLVPGRRVLEVGAAEGVLSLLMALDKDEVFALERQESRHAEALRLQRTWSAEDERYGRCQMVLGELRERMDLLERVDTLVAIRMIYYLEEDLQPVFERVAETVDHVVLGGNIGRAQNWQRTQGKGPPRRGFGPYDYYASLDGMKELLEGVGYQIVHEVADGDPIVVGNRA